MHEHEILERISRLEERVGVLETRIIKSPKGTASFSFDSVVDAFAKQLSIDLNKVRELYDFEESDFKLVSDVPGDALAEKQVNATLFILVALAKCYEMDTILASDLRKKLEGVGISLNNLSTTLAKYPRLILKKGKAKSHDFKYKITAIGVSEGLERLKNFLSGRGGSNAKLEG